MGKFMHKRSIINSRRTQSKLLIVIALILSSVSAACGSIAQVTNSDPDIPRNPYNGVKYFREVRTEPRPMVIHVVRIDLKTAGIKLLVTPGEKDSELPFQARTTSEFLDEFDLQIAINGDAFSPWYSLSILAYFPHSGDFVDVRGHSVSNGVVYSTNDRRIPTLCTKKNNFGRIDPLCVPGFNSISGMNFLINDGKVVEDIDSSSPEPRTAVGLNKIGQQLFLLVVDGRQSGYSEGATFEDLAAILLEYKAYRGFALDGGGSTTLVMADENGNPIVVNSPTHQGIPGRERPVGNHLGIYANP